MVATNLFNGSHATPLTQPLWSSNIFNLEPFLTSKTMAVESVLQEITNCEQGDQERPMTSCKWPRSVDSDVQFSVFTFCSSLLSPNRSGAASVSEYDQSQIPESTNQTGICLTFLSQSEITYQCLLKPEFCHRETNGLHLHCSDVLRGHTHT